MSDGAQELYDVALGTRDLKTGLTEDEVWGYIGSSWAPYFVYHAGTRDIAEEFIVY